MKEKEAVQEDKRRSDNDLEAWTAASWSRYNKKNGRARIKGGAFRCVQLSLDFRTSPWWIGKAAAGTGTPG